MLLITFTSSGGGVDIGFCKRDFVLLISLNLVAESVLDLYGCEIVVDSL
jgi:hypothetical protein